MKIVGQGFQKLEPEQYRQTHRQMQLKYYHNTFVGCNIGIEKVHKNYT